MNSFTISLDSTDINPEINEMMQHRSNYMQYLKDNYNKVKKSKSKKAKSKKAKNTNSIIIKLGKTSDESDSVELEGFSLMFYQMEGDNTSSFHLDIVDPVNKGEFILRKKLVIPKT